MKEVFKDIPNYKGLYQVSNLGNVKSLSRFNSLTERILKPYLRGPYYRKYRCFKLYKDNENRVYNASVLVAISFLNHNIKNGLIVDHIDNNSLNDKLSNLQIITQSENCFKDKKNLSSTYKGVSWNKNAKKYRSYKMSGKKQIHLGYFETEKEANKAYVLSL